MRAERVHKLETLVAAVAVGALAIATSARAQDWPTRPVTMMVPFAAGGPVDVLGRILAQHLSAAIGKPMIIDNEIEKWTVPIKASGVKED
jgi:tripartite-type tricarboxylate transporter receptor subunit TctC